MFNLIEKIIDKFVVMFSFLNRNNSPSYYNKQQNYFGDNVGRDKISKNYFYTNSAENLRLKSRTKNIQKKLDGHRQISDYFKRVGMLKTIDSGIDFGLITPAPATINPKNNYTVWQSTITITFRAVELAKILFRKNGDTYSDDIKNYRLYIDGFLIGKEHTSDIDNFIVFDMVYESKILKPGIRIMKLKGDISRSSSNKNFSFSLIGEGIYLIDSAHDTKVQPTHNGIKFVKLTSGEQKVN